MQKEYIMDKEDIRFRYNQLRHNNTMYITCMRISYEMDYDPNFTLGDINAIGRTAPPFKARLLIGNRICPCCGEHKNLVVEPLGEDENGKLSKAFDIYCTTKIEGDRWVDERLCLYHFKNVR